MSMCESWLGRLAAVAVGLGAWHCNNDPAASSRTVRHTLTGGVHTPLAIQVAPKASCTLRGDDNDDAHTLTLYADDRGMVRVYAQTDAPAGTALRLALECVGDDGATARTPIEISVGNAAYAPSQRALAPSGVLLPALDDDALALPNEALLARGYPPRPDAARTPGAYASWRALVSRPSTSVSPRSVAQPELRHDVNNRNNSTWSGALVQSIHAVPPSPYNWAAAQWTVPAIEQPTPASLVTAAVAEWVGIDDTRNNLDQAGTNSQSTTLVGVTISGVVYTVSVTKYFAWVESVPHPSRILPDLPIAPGDTVSVSVSVDATPLLGLPTVYYSLFNLTTNAFVTTSTTLPSQYIGRTVEFVIERPTLWSGVTPLANFDSSFMSHTEFSETSGLTSNLFYNGTDPSVPPDAILTNLTMVGGPNDPLATALIANFGEPGLSDIMFFWNNWN
jgi:hypothetical protein